MSERLQFLVKFILFATVICIVFFFFVNPYYRQLFNRIAWMLYKSKTPVGEYVTFHVRFYNSIPFLALMLATPKIRLLNRLKLMGLGLIIIFLIHFLFVIIGHAYTHETQSFLQRMLSSVSNAIGQVAVPLFVWFALAHTYVVRTFRPTTVKNGVNICPICGKKKKGLREHIQAVHRHEQGVEELLKDYSV